MIKLIIENTKFNNIENKWGSILRQYVLSKNKIIIWLGTNESFFDDVHIIPLLSITINDIEYILEIGLDHVIHIDRIDGNDVPEMMTKCTYYKSFNND